MGGPSSDLLSSFPWSFSCRSCGAVHAGAVANVDPVESFGSATGEEQGTPEGLVTAHIVDSITKWKIHVVPEAGFIEKSTRLASETN